MDACKINGIDIMSREDVENLPISDTAKENLMIIFKAQGCFDQKQGSVEKAIDYFKTKRRLEAARKSENKNKLKLTFDEAISHKSLAEIKEDRKAAFKVARNAVKHESTRQPLEQPKMKLTVDEVRSGKGIVQIEKDRKTKLEASWREQRRQAALHGKR